MRFRDRLLVLGAGAGAVSRCGGDRATQCWCWAVLGAGAGRRELARRCSALVPASDSEVIITAASDSEV